MKNSLFFAVILFSCHLQLLSQQPSVSIKLNEEERFRFLDQRLEFINPGYNVLIGENTGNNMDSAAVYNVFIGFSAGFQNTEGIRNSFLGTSSGMGNTTGDRNSYFGANSGQFNPTGKYNSFFGQGAGYDSQGSYNTFIGRVAGYYNRGDSSVFLGYGAGAFDTTSNKLYISNSTTIAPLVYGEFDNQILRFNVKKVDITSPYKNTIIGDSAGMLTVSPANVFIGMGSGNKTISGEENTFIGYKAGYENITGKENIFIGYRTGYENIDGGANVFLGNHAGHSNTEGWYNVFLGYWAGHSNSEGSNNVFVGGSAGVYNSTGIFNTFIGRSAGFHNTSGDRNTFVGLSAGGYNISGSKNTYIGRVAGFLNETGDSCVFIGNAAGYNEMGSNKLYIANSDTIAPLIYGEFDNELLRIHGKLDIKGIYHFPTTDGTSGQFMQTDGSGTLSWAKPKGDFSNGGEAGGANRSLGNTDNYDLSMKTNNTNRIKIKNDGGIRLDGKLGIFTDPASPGINNSIKLYDAVTFSNPYLEISGHNRAYIHLQSRRTGNTSETSGKTWSIASGSGSIADLDMFYIYNPDDGYCFTIRDGGNIGVNTTEPTAKMDINGSTGYDQLRIRTSFTPTSSSDTNGNTGDIAWDDDYIYIKTSTGWKRSALTSW